MTKSSCSNHGPNRSLWWSSNSHL